MKRRFLRSLCACLLGLTLAGCSATTSPGSAERAETPSASETASPPSATASPSPTSGVTAVASFYFAAIGDFGSGLQAEYDVAQRMCRWHRRHRFDIVITTGDNIYPDGDPDRFDEAFFRPMGCLLDRGVQFHASLGNHDVATDDGRPELEEPAFGMTGRNYVVRKGGVRFVIADSNDLDVEWLRQALKDEPGDLWTVVAFHHPVFSSGVNYGPGTGGFRPVLPRLFARRGVDLVLNGHEHVYQATRTIRGVRYVGTGGGGARLYGCRAPYWFTVRCIARYHFVSVKVTPTRMVVEAVPTAGAPFHRIRIRPDPPS